jgi:hypothetical protein
MHGLLVILLQFTQSCSAQVSKVIRTGGRIHQKQTLSKLIFRKINVSVRQCLQISMLKVPGRVVKNNFTVTKFGEAIHKVVTHLYNQHLWSFFVNMQTTRNLNRTDHKSNTIFTSSKMSFQSANNSEKKLNEIKIKQVPLKRCHLTFRTIQRHGQTRS